VRIDEHHAPAVRDILQAFQAASSADASLKAKIGCHTFRATGNTAYLEAGGTLENVQAMAAHESPRTTKPKYPG
jgi:integrase